MSHNDGVSDTVDGSNIRNETGAPSDIVDDLTNANVNSNARANIDRTVEITEEKEDIEKDIPLLEAVSKAQRQVIRKVKFEKREIKKNLKRKMEEVAEIQSRIDTVDKDLRKKRRKLYINENLIGTYSLRLQKINIEIEAANLTGSGTAMSLEAEARIKDIDRMKKEIYKLMDKSYERDALFEKRRSYGN